MKEFFTLALHHLGHWHSRPFGNHLSDILTGNLFRDHGHLMLVDFLLKRFELFFLLGYLPITEFGHLTIITLTFGTLGLYLIVFYIVLGGLYLVHKGLFSLPFGKESITFFP